MNSTFTVGSMQTHILSGVGIAPMRIVNVKTPHRLTLDAATNIKFVKTEIDEELMSKNRYDIDPNSSNGVQSQLGIRFSLNGGQTTPTANVVTDLNFNLSSLPAPFQLSIQRVGFCSSAKVNPFYLQDTFFYSANVLTFDKSQLFLQLSDVPVMKLDISPAQMCVLTFTGDGKNTIDWTVIVDARCLEDF